MPFYTLIWALKFVNRHILLYCKFVIYNQMSVKNGVDIIGYVEYNSIIGNGGVIMAYMFAREAVDKCDIADNKMGA